MNEWPGYLLVILGGAIAGMSGSVWLVLLVALTYLAAALSSEFVLRGLKGYESEGAHPKARILGGVASLCVGVLGTFGWSLFVTIVGHVALVYVGIAVVAYVVDAVATKAQRTT